MTHIRLPSLKVRTSAFQAEDAGFKSRGSHFMGRYTVIGSGPDCKSGAFGFCWFKSNPTHCVYIDENIPTRYNIYETIVCTYMCSAFGLL